MAMIIIQDEKFVNGYIDNRDGTNPAVLTGNILTTLSALILCLYTVYYAQKLTRLIKSP